ncbi:helix-turn-helix domain-containing protein [Caldanaerobacter subterraneus]|uniref:helix-turn-helix domain-containing protein n=1 Tax=Caldanaerobacter subterraneus TaxID=911092 RepID=UPI0032BFC6F4
MNELGEFLKSERLKKGMTLEEIQEITKIRTRYLKAIEDGDFSVMPAMVYAKGFVKSYAEALGLDGNEIVKKYEHLFKEKEEENLSKAKSYKKTTLDLSWLFSALKKALVSILIIGIIGYGFYYFFAQIKKGLAPLPPKQEVSQTVPKKNETPSTPSTQENVTSTVSPKTVIEKVSETSKKIEYKISPASQSYKVEINMVGEKCWFSIKVDGNVVYEGLMTAGMMKTFEVKNDITILMGYPPAVKISVDGEELPAVSSPSPVTINIHT